MQSIKQFALEQATLFDKVCSFSTLKRIFKRHDFIWKRMRSSLREKRNESLFRWFQKELLELKQLALNEEINLCYFDETGINLKPNVPYAWQPKGTTIELPAQRKKGITVMGILDPIQNEFFGTLYQGAANSKCVIQTLEDYAQTITRKTIVILDNASIHKAKIVKEKQKEWKKKGLYLQFIPPYCPELNLIEILWKHLKAYWLRPKHYESMEILEKNTIQILQQYGKNYVINFE